MNNFVNYLHEVFEPLGSIQSRKMFGGYGLYHNGLMFALVADDTLYLKVDKINLDDFLARGLEPFEYGKAGKVVKMSYYLAPEEIFDDPDEAILWAQRAYAAAVRTRGNRK